ncbi:uncharacterized protein SETTUDRAFT_39592 [Exserohilum turcica Et28A]|uniref:Uncharacterized protein n=1 Tax=Exserohilum turcicum (strain 28A) TaxID=671987 RepID=R0IN87_EXST2|nr:uncharacterized protein SETTUDRAFT_39592 [Exserohilum turcica Et28A]EOA86465.1 hypothetical protein SETTUDRAFT_39592 [Exserohilum turcica Et28A]
MGGGQWLEMQLFVVVGVGVGVVLAGVVVEQPRRPMGVGLGRSPWKLGAAGRTAGQSTSARRAGGDCVTQPQWFAPARPSARRPPSSPHAHQHQPQAQPQPLHI